MAITLNLFCNEAVGFIDWLGVRVMQKQGHRGVINDRLVISQNVRPEHALHTRRSLREESFVHVCKIDSVNAITAKRLAIQRQCRAVQRMYCQRDASGSAAKLAAVPCRPRPVPGGVAGCISCPRRYEPSRGTASLEGVR